MKLKPEAAAWEPIPGVPWRDMSDAEFAEIEKEYDAHFSPEQAGSLARWFEHLDDDDAKPAKKTAATAAGGDR